MDPTPSTAWQVFATLGAVLGGTVVGLAWAALLFLPIYLVVDRWWDRRALRKAQAAWAAWEAEHPSPPPREEAARRWQLREELREAAQPAYLQAYSLRHRLAEAQHEPQVEAILEAERRGGRDGR